MPTLYKIDRNGELTHILTAATIPLLRHCVENKLVTFDGVSHEKSAFEADIILKDGYEIHDGAGSTVSATNIVSPFPK